MSIKSVSNKFIRGSLSQLQQGKTATITGLGADLPYAYQRRLTELRYIEGEPIRMVQRNGQRSFIVKIGSDSPFAIDDQIANSVLVHMNSEDVFVKSHKPLLSKMKALVAMMFSK